MKKNTIIIFTLSLLVTLGSITLFVFLSWYVSSSHEKVEEQVGATEQELRHLAGFEDLKKLIATLEGQKESLSSVFVTEETTVDFIQSVESLGGTYGVRVDIASVGASGEGREKHIAMNISAQGSWERVLSFVRALEYMPYAVTLKTVSLRKGVVEDEKTSSGWRADIQLQVQSK